MFQWRCPRAVSNLCIFHEVIPIWKWLPGIQSTKESFICKFPWNEYNDSLVLWTPGSNFTAFLTLQPRWPLKQQTFKTLANTKLSFILLRNFIYAFKIFPTLNFLGNSPVFKVSVPGSQFKIGISAWKRDKNQNGSKISLLGPKGTDWW